MMDVDPRLAEAAELAGSNGHYVRPVRFGLLRRRVIREAGTEREYRLGAVTRLFLWCGAVDRDLLVTRAECYRYVNLGVFVVLVAGLAGTTFTLYAVTILGRFSWWYLPGALMWAVLIFFLDRSIVGEPSYGDLSLATVSRRRAARATKWAGPGKSLAYLFRIVVALLIAYLVSEAIMLTLFRPEIQMELGVRHAAQFREATEEYVVPRNREIQDLNRQIEANDKAVAAAQAAVQTAYGTWQAELNGSGGSHQAGQGSKTQDEYQAYQDAKSYAQKLQETTRVTNDALARRANTDKTEVTAIQAGDVAGINQIPDLAHRRTDIYANTGWVEQEAALADYLNTQRGNLTVTVVPWVVRAILVAIDLVPLMLKIANGSTIYGHRQHDRAAQLRYADAAAEQAHAEQVDRSAELDRKRSLINYQVAAQREDWRRDRSLGYLRGPG